MDINSPGKNKQMTVGELIAKLSKMDLDKEVMILDGYNGYGNIMPISYGPSFSAINEYDVKHNAGYKGRDREVVVIVGP